MLGDSELVQAVLDDYTRAPISDRDKALFAFLEKVNRAANEIEPGDVEAVRAAGWSEEAIYDAITVCALFNFYNVWVDATGVSHMSPEAYEMSARRLAEDGYVDRD